MIVVIPVCAKDVSLALKNLSWLKRLKQKKTFHAIIACDSGFDASEVITAASLVFASVGEVRYTKWEGDQSWPTPQNYAWQSTARHMAKLNSPWFWWEADATPLAADWLEQIWSAYQKEGKPFAGHVLKNEGFTYMAGVGVYPPRVSVYSLDAMLCRAAAFDVVLGQSAINQTADIKDLIQHTLLPVTFKDKSYLKTVLNRAAVLFHKCKDGSIIDVLTSGKPTRTEAGNMFVHGGDLGDIIYSLPTVKALGGGSMFFNTKQGTREPMTVNRASFIAPLLERQDYISRAEMIGSQSPTHDLNAFRDYKDNNYKWGMSLAEWHCAAFNINPKVLNDPWLACGQRKVEKVVIHRSERYQNDAFDWKRVLSFYKKNIVFVGLKSEHSNFQSKFGKVPFFKVQTALEMAEIINGSQLFIGNQSFPNSIAEGLKHPKLLETWINEPDCCFENPKAQYVVTKYMHLPALC